jgi:hypothetical protein
LVAVMVCVAAGCHAVASYGSQGGGVDLGTGQSDGPRKPDAVDAVDAVAPDLLPSCAALHAARPDLPSGVYEIDPDGEGPSSPFSAFCEMAADDGGWTLLLKADGTRPTFRFASPLWSNAETLNPQSPDLDFTEAKLAGFNNMPFSQLRLGMHDGSTLRWIVVGVTGEVASLHQALSTIEGEQRGTPETVVPTHAGRATWLELLADPSLQEACNQEGLNNDDGYGSRVRIGIVGNYEDECGNTDSWIGFGGKEDWCAEPITATVGNGDCYFGTAPVTNHDQAAFGYVMIRR